MSLGQPTPQGGQPAFPAQPAQPQTTDAPILVTVQKIIESAIKDGRNNTKNAIESLLIFLGVATKNKVSLLKIEAFPDISTNLVSIINAINFEKCNEGIIDRLKEILPIINGYYDQENSLSQNDSAIPRSPARFLFGMFAVQLIEAIIAKYNEDIKLKQNAENLRAIQTAETYVDMPAHNPNENIYTDPTELGMPAACVDAPLESFKTKHNLDFATSVPVSKLPDKNSPFIVGRQHESSVPNIALPVWHGIPSAVSRQAFQIYKEGEVVFITKSGSNLPIRINPDDESKLVIDADQSQTYQLVCEIVGDNMLIGYSECPIEDHGGTVENGMKKEFFLTPKLWAKITHEDDKLILKCIMDNSIGRAILVDGHAKTQLLIGNLVIDFSGNVQNGKFTVRGQRIMPPKYTYPIGSTLTVGRLAIDNNATIPFMVDNPEISLEELEITTVPLIAGEQSSTEITFKKVNDSKGAIIVQKLGTASSQSVIKYVNDSKAATFKAIEGEVFNIEIITNSKEPKISFSVKVENGSLVIGPTQRNTES